MVARWCCTMTHGDLTHFGSSSTKSTSTMKYANVTHQKVRNTPPCHICSMEYWPVAIPQKGEARHCQFMMSSAITGKRATKLNQSCTSRARLESWRRGPNMRKASSMLKWSSMMLLAFLSERSAYSMPSCIDSSAASFTSSPNIDVNSAKDWRLLGDDIAAASTACDSRSVLAVRASTASGVAGSASAALCASSATLTARRAASAMPESSTATMASGPAGTAPDFSLAGHSGAEL
mmetsp:Transcript_135046/g.376271  ORF Transcript_135046/g.376271 Transcript_135046/m.376271 type:complete len:235 (+) Transcript_135046:362-1066(+)